MRNPLYSLKPGASLDKMAPEFMEQLPKIAELWDTIFPDDADGMTITAGCEGTPGDGVHMRTSKHYQGKAVDLRVFDVHESKVWNDFVPQVRALLGNKWDVVVETHTTTSGVRVSHVHIEYDPKPWLKG